MALNLSTARRWYTAVLTPAGAASCAAGAVRGNVIEVMIGIWLMGVGLWFRFEAELFESLRQIRAGLPKVAEAETKKWVRTPITLRSECQICGRVSTPIEITPETPPPYFYPQTDCEHGEGPVRYRAHWEKP